MVKRNRSAIKERRQAREQQQKQARLVQIGALLVGVFVIGMIGFFALRAGNSGPSVPVERLERDPVLGNPDAPITIVEYAAFGCEACRSWHEAGVVDQILAQYPNQVKFIFRDMPIIIPAWSQAMGEIAQCAFDQGNDGFWTAHDIIFEDTVQGRTNQSDTLDIIEEANTTLDMPTLRECVSNNTHFNTVRYDMERPEALGIRGTPTWFVNGQQVYSASPSTIIQMIETELDS
ncbi:MAG: thioredoxin domain-containing protein [Phototrophicaceae bacterium]